MNNNHALYDPQKVIDHPEFKVLTDEEAKALPKDVNMMCAYNPKQYVWPA